MGRGIEAMVAYPTNACSQGLGWGHGRRIYFQWDGVNLRLFRTEGFRTSPNAEITVREPDADQVPWGVWVNGERSPNTWVIVNGVPLAVAHPSGVPILCRSAAEDWPVWDQHEARGGRESVLAFL